MFRASFLNILSLNFPIGIMTITPNLVSLKNKIAIANKRQALLRKCYQKLSEYKGK